MRQRFDVSPATLVAIIGRSGSGKTTLLNVIGGVDTPTAGTVLPAGRDVTHLGERERNELRRHTIAFIFQSFALLPCAGYVPHPGGPTGLRAVVLSTTYTCAGRVRCIIR